MLPIPLKSYFLMTGITVGLLGAALSQAAEEGAWSLPPSQPQSSVQPQVQDVQLLARSEPETEPAEKSLAERMEDTAKTVFGTPTALRQRATREIKLAQNPLAFLPYKANYFLPVSYYSGYSKSVGYRDSEYGPVETQFQISLKFPLGSQFFFEDDGLMIAYTQQSHWQLYQESSPFRETTYEPELIYGVSTEYDIFDELTLEGILLGLNHQSNGQSGSFSRSWNRVFAEAIFASGDWGIAVRRWFRIPEQAEDDDNPDITKFVGLSEVDMAYSKANHVLTFRMRNHLDSDFSRGNMQFSWSFPLSGERYKGYLLVKTGYGDTLADYDHYTNRIGLGISINDVL
ncbi:phospholipase A [Oceanospirillum maris]|jgi:phospholipase A1|uniref:phospholipase A n=1 Tax=Oceanospirillum maris TaxID=64977 RepID=UPI0003FF94E3|nr:phospholipase A [Oceanospirillum maris]